MDLILNLVVACLALISYPTSAIIVRSHPRGRPDEKTEGRLTLMSTWLVRAYQKEVLSPRGEVACVYLIILGDHHDVTGMSLWGRVQTTIDVFLSRM